MTQMSEPRGTSGSKGVFANHAHVFPASMNQAGTIERLLQMLDACHIEQAICFAPFPHQCDKNGLDPNTWLATELEHHAGRLFGFGTIDFRRDSDIESQVQQAADLGLKGLKLHPNAQDFGITDPIAMRAYGAAERHGLFITFHSGVHQSRLSDTRVLLFDEVAWSFPKLKFSMEHVGGYHFFEEALAVLFNHVPPPWAPGKCNVFAGLASIFSQQTNRFWYLSEERLRELIAQIGVNQMIFGLDFPYNKEKETMLGITTIRERLGLSDADAAMVLGGNLRRELGL